MGREGTGGSGGGEGRRRPQARGIEPRPAFLALGLFLGTAPCFVPGLRVFRDVSGGSYVMGGVGTAMAVACLACATASIAVMAARPGWRPRIPSRLPLVAALAYCAAQAGFCALSTVAAGAATRAAAALLGAAMGACCLPVCACWLRRFDGLGFRSTLFHCACACLAMAALSWAAGLLPRAVAVAAWLLAASVGALAPVLSPAGVASGPGGADGRAGRPGGARVGSRADAGEWEGARGALKASLDMLSAIWVPLLGLLVGLFCSSLSEMSLSGSAVRSELAGLAITAALAVGLCLTRGKTPLVVVIDRGVVPALCALAVLMSSLPASEPPSAPLVYLVYLPVSFMSIYGAACIASIRNYPRLLIASTMLAACCAVSLAGTALEVSLGSLDATGPVVRAAQGALYAVVMVELGMSAWRSTVEREALGAPGVQDGRAEGPSAIEAARQRRARQLSGMYGLTAREGEIADYLSRGYNANYIAKSLFISGNTVRTHMRSIYRKMGVGSRQEFLALFNEAR